MVVQRSGNSDVSSDEVRETARRGIRTHSTALPYTKDIQRSFGHHDISGIRFHNSPEAAQSARAMNAEAYSTAGHVVSAGSISKHTAAHEAAHVVQQRSGVHFKGGVGAVGDKYERHADAVADRVVAGQSAADLLAPYAGVSAGVQTDGPVQRKVFIKSLWGHREKTKTADGAVGEGERNIQTMMDSDRNYYFQSKTEMKSYARAETDNIGYQTRENTWVRLHTDGLIVLGEQHSENSTV